jgi:hypothetical protein
MDQPDRIHREDGMDRSCRIGLSFALKDRSGMSGFVSFWRDLRHDRNHRGSAAHRWVHFAVKSRFGRTTASLRFCLSVTTAAEPAATGNGMFMHEHDRQLEGEQAKCLHRSWV